MDPKAKAKYIEAEKMRTDYEAKIREDLEPLWDPKTQSKEFTKNLEQYTNPKVNIVVGVLLTMCVGIIAPSFGWFIMEMMTGMNVAFYMKTSVFDEIMEWLILMICGSVLIMFAKAGSMILLAKVAERIVQGTRKDLYESILRKNVGWHDDKENSSGVMTATLSSDVQTLNGVSSDGLAVMVEAATALLYGIGFAFYWSWPLALVCIGCTPIIMIAGTIAAKADNEAMLAMEEDESENDKTDEQKASQILASDSITNYKTVASFGNDHILLDEFDKINHAKATNEVRNARCDAFGLALAQALQNGIFAIMYLATGELYYAYPDYKYT